MSNGPSLYEISVELRPLEEALEASGGDLEVLDAALVERVTDLLTATKQKVDAYGRFAKEIEATVDVVAQEIKRLQERKQVYENRLKRLKTAALDAMTARDVVRIEGELTTILRQKNGGKPAMTVMKKPEELPEKYQRRVIEAKTEDLRRDAEAGDAEALALVEFAKVGFSVRIK